MSDKIDTPRTEGCGCVFDSNTADLLRECDYHKDMWRRAAGEAAETALKLRDEKASIIQSITDEENQPSQYATVTLEMYLRLAEKLAAAEAVIAECAGLHQVTHIHAAIRAYRERK